MMQFLVDEGCDAIIVRTLRALGYDVEYVAEINPGMTDIAILQLGVDEKRIVITEDRDFSELIFRDSKETYGIVFVRISDAERLIKATQITSLVNHHINELQNAIATIMATKIKIRPILRD